jgi:hypothetical protein
MAIVSYELLIFSGDEEQNRTVVLDDAVLSIDSETFQDPKQESISIPNRIG